MVPPRRQHQQRRTGGLIWRLPALLAIAAFCLGGASAGPLITDYATSFDGGNAGGWVVAHHTRHGAESPAPFGRLLLPWHPPCTATRSAGIARTPQAWSG